MEDRSHAIIAIIFLALFGVGAGLVAWWMLAPSVARVPYVLESQASVAGLGPGSPVDYHGVRVGGVRKVSLDSRDRHIVDVRIAVDKDFPLPKGTYATVASQGLIGNKSVSLTLGKSGESIETSHESPAHLKLRPGQLAGLMSQAGEIVDEVKATLKSVQSVLNEQNRQSLTATLANVRKATARLAALEKAAEPTVRAMPGVVADARRTLASAHRLLKRADGLVAEARGPLHSVGHAASSAGAVLAQVNQTTVPQLESLMKRLRALSEHLQGLTVQLQSTPQSLILGSAPPKPGPGESKGHSGKGGG